RAGAVPTPLINHQIAARHQVKHVLDDGLVDPRRRALTIRRVVVLALRPEAMHDKGKRAAAALRLRHPIGRAFLGARAPRWRPAQRQHVVIELAGHIRLLLAGPAGTLVRLLLDGCRSDAEKEDGGGKAGAPGRADEINEHGTPPLTQLSPTDSDQRAGGNKPEIYPARKFLQIYTGQENNARTN